MNKKLYLLYLVTICILLLGCSKKIDSYIAKSENVVNEDGYLDDGKAYANLDEFLSVPTYITKIKDYYFIVDCYHNKVIYNSELSPYLTSWKVMTDDINMGHTICSDGLVYLVDDTENNRILVFEERLDKDGEVVFENTQEFKNIGNRPHYIVYNEKTKTFYAWSSLTGEMFLFRRNEDSPQMYLTDIKKIDELDGFYVRSFTIIDDKIYFVSGNMNIIEADLESFNITKRYPVTDSIAGMVQLTKIQDYYYITVSTDAMANQDAATIIRTDNLDSLSYGEYEDVYDNFIGGGTPYVITEIEGTYYLCEHRLPGHSIWSFNVENNEIINIETLF